MHNYTPNLMKSCNSKLLLSLILIIYTDFSRRYLVLVEKEVVREGML